MIEYLTVGILFNIAFLIINTLIFTILIFKLNNIDRFNLLATLRKIVDNEYDQRFRYKVFNIFSYFIPFYRFYISIINMYFLYKHGNCYQGIIYAILKTENFCILSAYKGPR